MPTKLLSALALVLALCPHAAHADAEAGKQKSQVCEACHGPAGHSANQAFPNLAGQTMRYIYLQLKDFKEGRRGDPSMDVIAATLSRDDMLDLAEYFSKQPALANRFAADPARVARGRAKADETLCTMCHLGGMKGQNEIPRVAGQNPEYVVKQLTAFKARTRTNDAGNMTSVAQTLNEENIVDLSHYLANLD
jgi:cytochrome c553